MSNLAEFDDIAPKEDPLRYIAIDIDSSCETCGLAVDSVFLSKNKRVVTYICPEGHVVSVEGNYQWLVRLLG